MNVSKLNTILESHLPGKVFELAAPQGVKEYVVWHEYGSNLLVGDDVVQAEVPKIQIDVIWQEDRTIFSAVKAALTEAGQPYDLISIGYDDDWAAMRAVLQLEVV